MKVKTLIMTTLALAICLLVIIGGGLAFFPAWFAARFGLDAPAPERIWLVTGFVMALLIMLSWVTERLFTLAGKSGLELQWRRNSALAASEMALPGKPEPEGLYFGNIGAQLRFRYGPFWRRRVRLLLVVGEPSHVEQLVPGLTGGQWLEGEGTVLLWGGDGLTAEVQRWRELRPIRRTRPLDGVVWVMALARLPDSGSVDASLRQAQRREALLRWRSPVYLWLLAHSDWPQDNDTAPPVGCFLPQGCGREALEQSLGALLPGLTGLGMRRVLADRHQDFPLRLAQTLLQQGIPRLLTLCGPMLHGPSALWLRGVMFSLPAPSVTEAAAHSWLPALTWSGPIRDSGGRHGRRLETVWEKRLQCGTLALTLVWGMGSLVSFSSNRAAIGSISEQAWAAGDSRRSLAERLRCQLNLQQDIARLQYRSAAGSPWHVRFGLDQNDAQLAVAWAWYRQSFSSLIQDAAAARLHSALSHMVNLPRSSPERAKLLQSGYERLKAYMMMARPDKAEPDFLSAVLKANLVSLPGVPPGLWRHAGPALLDFYARQLPAHTDWRIEPDGRLVSAARQLLLRQISMRNAETTLYQRVLKQVAQHHANLTLADMVGETDAGVLFTTRVSVPGMFTRQAWEGQVQKAIEQVVAARREEIDWVLSDNKQPAPADLLPDKLKSRLTTRYFIDFAGAWLDFLNNLQWREASTLSDSIDQLTLMADARESPLTALLHTVGYQAKTGRQSQALADALRQSAQQLLKSAPHPGLLTDRSSQGPLDATFGPLLTLMDGAATGQDNNSLSVKTFLTRVTRIRLKLQQITHAYDPQAMTQALAQTVFQGQAVDLTDTRDYGGLLAASLGAQWNALGQTLFVKPLEQSWQQILQPSARGLNALWQRAIVAGWNADFGGRYPFADTASDASLAALAQYLRADSGHIEHFLKTRLGGVVHKEGGRWVADGLSAQGLKFDPAFLPAINQLSQLTGMAFIQGDACIRFELMARPAGGLVQSNLNVDGQELRHFNQMESWQSFVWPGAGFKPGATLSWRSVSAGDRIYADKVGNWGLIRLLAQARVTRLDTCRHQVTWIAPDGLPLTYILRTELGDGPLAMLLLNGFRLPARIFDNGLPAQGKDCS